MGGVGSGLSGACRQAVSEIRADILALEQETEGLLDEIIENGRGS